MPAAGFEPAIPATEPLKTHALKAERAVINFSQSSEMANWRSECKETVLPVLIKTFIYSDKSEMKLLDSLHAQYIAHAQHSTQQQQNYSYKMVRTIGPLGAQQSASLQGDSRNCATVRQCPPLLYMYIIV